MRYMALAVDFDGTIAHDGLVAPATIDALRQVAASGRKLLLVTGRELDELLSIFPDITLFDRVVAENGALLYRPATGERAPLGDPVLVTTGSGGQACALADQRGALRPRGPRCDMGAFEAGQQNSAVVIRAFAVSAAPGGSATTVVGRLESAAEVTFSLPTTGPGGIFPGLQLTKTVRTNVQGQAAASGFTPNNQAGQYTIHVTAKAGNLTGTAEIRQNNLVGAPEPTRQSWIGRWKYWLIAGGAAAAAAGIILATQGDGGGTSTDTTITITPGTVVIGGGR